MDVVIEGKALLDSGLTSCCIGIADGRIAKIAKTISTADRRHDLSNLLLLPAGIDLHVHFREPGMTHKEDFNTGSMSAVAGGTTFVMDMPNTLPATRSLSDLNEKIGTASGKCYADFGMAALLDSRTSVESLAGRATALKMYIGETTGGLGVRQEEIPTLLGKAAAAKLPLMVHAEHTVPLAEIEETDLDGHDRRRSDGYEHMAAKAVCGKKPQGMRLHLLHVTTARVLKIARESGSTAEITPHHLLLDKSMKLGTWGKVNPPLRSKSTRLKLWEALASGLGDTVGSDHSPHTIAEKEEDFDAAPSGMPGAETRMPLMLQAVAERRLDIVQLSRYCCRRPAEIIGVPKGQLKEGFDADIIAVDLRTGAKISADKLHSKCGWSAFDGMRAIFPRAVFLRGEKVSEAGEIVGERAGRYFGGGGSG